MKVLDLQCPHGHGFEGWFASGEAFESQLAAGLVACPVCASTAIVKRLSAPRINLGRALPASLPAATAAPAASVSVEAGASAPNAPPTAVPAQSVEPHARWLQAVREVIARTEDVGERFPEEARKMHYGDAAQRSIRGQATREEAEALIDEGIAVLPLPGLAARKETLQ